MGCMNKTTFASILFAAAIGATSANTQADILIGQTAGVSGPVAAGVGETIAGAMLHFDAVNAKGGIKGEKIKLITLDDKFEPKLASENAARLITEHKVVALFLTRGTPPTEAIMPLLAEHKVALVGPSTGAMLLHSPVNPYVFNVRTSYQLEAEKAVDYLATLSMNRVVVVHADDSFGADVLVGANRGFAKAKFTPLEVIKANRQKPDYSKITPVVLKHNPHAVLWVGSSGAVSEGVKLLRAAGYEGTFLTQSNNASGGFIKSLGESSRGVVVSQVFPNERAFGVPMVKEARELAAAKNMGEISPAMLEGFAAAKVLVEGLRRAGSNPTRKKVLAALEDIKKFDIGGMDITYGPDDHTGLDFVDLSIIGKGGKFRR
jgi:branched-chain amino acid transport system substrate-binding protein